LRLRWLIIAKKTQMTTYCRIPVKLIRAGGRTIHSEIHKNMTSILNKEEFPADWKESIIVYVYKKGDKT
jgi:hypothetical protein